jgi:hypothetical protein
VLVNDGGLCNIIDDLIETFQLFVVQVRSQGLTVDLIILVIFSIVQIHATRIRGPPVCQKNHIFPGNLFYAFNQQFAFFFPAIFIFYVHDFSLQITAVNRSLTDVQLLQLSQEDVRNACGIAILSIVFQVLELYLERINEILDIHSVFAGLVQEKIQIEIVVRIVAVVIVVTVICCDASLGRQFNDLLVLFHDKLLKFLVLIQQFK